MKKFNSPLDDIHIASPCKADWNAMYGNDRKRFCSECKLNVYNLSELTRQEAEQFLLRSEGDLCVRFYRRRDGSVITRDCPVGLRAMKQRVSRVISACFAVLAGFLSGIAGMEALSALNSFVSYERESKSPAERDNGVSFGGGLSNLKEIKNEIKLKTPRKFIEIGRAEMPARPGKKRLKASVD